MDRQPDGRGDGLSDSAEPEWDHVLGSNFSVRSYDHLLRGYDRGERNRILVRGPRNCSVGLVDEFGGKRNHLRAVFVTRPDT